MKSAELKAYLEGVIADLPEQELDINIDMMLFFRWWDKPHSAGGPLLLILQRTFGQPPL